VESFNGKIRDELLAIEEFTTLLEAKIMAEDFRQHYNSYRPHSSLKYQTPEEFTLNWHHNKSRLRKILVH
jgi:transposase InsO family protein